MRFFTVIILSGILCLFCFQMAQSAEMKVLDNNVFVETDAYEVQFSDGVITQIHNKLTGEAYTLPLDVGGVFTGISGHSGLLRRNGGPVWTDQATLTEAKKIAPLKAEIVFRQGQNEFRLFIGVDARSGDLLIEQEGTSDTEGVYGIQWGCGNLDVRNLDIVLPAEGGQIIDAEYPAQLRHKKFPDPLNVVCILKTQLMTQRKSHVLLFSSDLALDAETLIDSYALRFQIEFNFRDAKQFWGLEDFMNVNKTPVNNTANLSMFMVNVSAKLLAPLRLEHSELSVLDLKAHYRGLKYLRETLKILPQKPDPIVIDNLAEHLGAIGAIHYTSPQIRPG